MKARETENNTHVFDPLTHRVKHTTVLESEPRGLATSALGKALENRWEESRDLLFSLWYLLILEGHFPLTNSTGEDM